MNEKNGEHPFGDTGQIALGGLFIVIWVLDSFVFKWTTFMGKSVSIFVRAPLALGLFVLAFLLIQSSHRVVEGNRDHLLTEGIFRFVRHPLYLGSLLVYLGLAISTLSLASLGLLVCMFLFYDFIGGYEEKLLSIKFGEEYQKYKKKTGKWFPRITGHKNQ
jgi:protein-S-isoprenylcysteine O-methyltransferase Ste14